VELSTQNGSERARCRFWRCWSHQARFMHILGPRPESQSPASALAKKPLPRCAPRAAHRLLEGQGQRRDRDTRRGLQRESGDVQLGLRAGTREAKSARRAYVGGGGVRTAAVNPSKTSAAGTAARRAGCKATCQGTAARCLDHPRIRQQQTRAYVPQLVGLRARPARRRATRKRIPTSTVRRGWKMNVNDPVSAPEPEPEPEPEPPLVREPPPVVVDCRRPRACAPGIHAQAASSSTAAAAANGALRAILMLVPVCGMVNNREWAGGNLKKFALVDPVRWPGRDLGRAVPYGRFSALGVRSAMPARRCSCRGGWGRRPSLGWVGEAFPPSKTRAPVNALLCLWPHECTS
jgi:hypothetical protein